MGSLALARVRSFGRNVNLKPRKSGRGEEPESGSSPEFQVLVRGRLLARRRPAEDSQPYHPVKARRDGAIPALKRREESINEDEIAPAVRAFHRDLLPSRLLCVTAPSREICPSDHAAGRSIAQAAR